MGCEQFYIDHRGYAHSINYFYHLLENLAEWKKPDVVGISKKMDRKHIKSDYCFKNATNAFSDLIGNANCKHILFSYNNTQKSKDDRSNARISDDDIFDILNNKGKVVVFEMSYKAFTTGKSNSDGNIERVFYCKVK